MGEVDEETGAELPLVLAEPPEDWTGPLDNVERDDLGYTETDMAGADWAQPLEPSGRVRGAKRGAEPGTCRRGDRAHGPPGRLVMDTWSIRVLAIRSRPRLAWLTVVIVLTACAALRVGSDYDHSASFAAYHSFTWLARERHGSANPLVVQRAHDAIQAELTQKGFASASDAAAADFAVDFTIGAQERTEARSYPAPYTGWWGYPDWWGYPYWGSQVDVRQYREGTLAIDIFDARTRRPIWHGWAKKELTRSDIERSEAPIRAAVHAVLLGFPPT